MLAAIVPARNQSPVYGEFAEPPVSAGNLLLHMRSAALSGFSKARSVGAHYSSEAIFPAVAGAEGVGVDEAGRRLYFMLPVAPYGALAERCPVIPSRCVAVPDGLDDVTAAALANPGMSAWAALVERSGLQRGETVLINGATGSAGRLAVQVARHLGAGRVIAAGRNVAVLNGLRANGADEVLAFDLEAGTAAQRAHQQRLQEVFEAGVDVVLDYLWGTPAELLLAARAVIGGRGRPLRFVQIGCAAGRQEIALPGAVLRATDIRLLGSGLGSVAPAGMAAAVRSIFAMAVETGMRLPAQVMPLAQIGQAWQASAGQRVVVTMD